MWSVASRTSKTRNQTCVKRLRRYIFSYVIRTCWCPTYFMWHFDGSRMNFFFSFFYWDFPFSIYMHIYAYPPTCTRSLFLSVLYAQTHTGGAGEGKKKKKKKKEGIRISREVFCCVHVSMKQQVCLYCCH
uniref:Uncharacterized protein n=1 Tax=Trypanosoma vivax (strain Y486) TaxID=1055687 RepID=G0U554_TRYVY|nr:hypothetical protein TVY486_1000560 [Trypanosoma vivax Y486]